MVVGMSWAIWTICLFLVEIVIDFQVISRGGNRYMTVEAKARVRVSLPMGASGGHG